MELDKKYAAKGYPVLAINPNDPEIVPDDSYENMVSRSEEKKYSFPYLFDATQEIAMAYGATRTPHIYILEKAKDKYVVKYIGAIDNNSDEPEKADKKYVEDAVDALLAGKSVPTSETKAVGCGIKWKKKAE
jgi:peroxiredoxin